jgi:hypothetical protein
MSREDHRKASEATRRAWVTRREWGPVTRGDVDVELVPAFRKGEYMGTMRWVDVSGEVTQCVVKRGPRANQIQVGKTVCGWDFLTERIRKRLARPRRVARMECLTSDL